MQFLVMINFLINSVSMSNFLTFHDFFWKTPILSWLFSTFVFFLFFLIFLTFLTMWQPCNRLQFTKLSMWSVVNSCSFNLELKLSIFLKPITKLLLLPLLIINLGKQYKKLLMLLEQSLYFSWNYFSLKVLI